MIGLAALLGPVINTLIDRLIPDKAEADKAKLEMENKLVETANQVNLAQIEVNKAEAAHRTIFVAGWRPALGWVCAAGFTWAFVGAPIAEWIMAIQGINAELPVINTDILLELVFGMLGLAGLRSWEKSRGLTK
ncbi:3TM-type holin [Candidatus Vondammii sp. HM_W22]|uniref:3TM-type holin n=1 Tax=Candidatus Vondammii sp. HM_W22 TaxID=2687299 RepID=UPI002E7B9F92|nr:3TM-type holin [Candidatus Vondammii sp. HM_W22]